MIEATQGARIVALVTHARQVPAAHRTALAMRLRERLPVGALVLETCHRVEAYLRLPDEPAALSLSVDMPPGGLTLTGAAAVRHAVAVAAGSDSVVVGEDQVLHQIRLTVESSRNAGTLDPTLERLFASALQAGRRARSWRSGPQRSLADVALGAVEDHIGPIRDRRILVVGAGQMGRLMARAAAAAGAVVSIANRSTARADGVASATGARVVAFDPGHDTGSFAAVVVALGGPWSVGVDARQALHDGTTVVVDLSVPASVPLAIADGLGDRFVSADDLARVSAEPAGSHDPTAARSEALIERTTADFLAWLDGHSSRAVAEALVERSDREREAELAALWRRLPDLEPAARDAIEGMTRHLAKRLLREPLERLGRDSDGSNERAVREIFAL